MGIKSRYWKEVAENLFADNKRLVEAIRLVEAKADRESWQPTAFEQQLVNAKLEARKARQQLADLQYAYDVLLQTHPVLGAIPTSTDVRHPL